MKKFLFRLREILYSDECVTLHIAISVPESINKHISQYICNEKFSVDR